MSRLIDFVPIKVQLKVSQTDACIVRAYTSKQHEELTRYVILFVLKHKTESIFHLP